MSISRQGARLAIAAGLLIRLAAAPAYGTQDVEWWKAWGGDAVKHGVTTIYGAADETIIDHWRAGRAFPEIVAATQRVIHFEPYEYWRTEYKLGQPPLYIYSLFLSTKAYEAISPDLRNGRLFNVALNIPPLIASALLAWMIAAVVAVTVSPEAGVLAGLAYWLNPLVILNSPIQGYQDPLCALFATASIVMAHRRRLSWSAVLLALAALTKPQGILVAPIIVSLALFEHGWRARLHAAAAAIGTGLLVGLPFIINGRLLSVILGAISISEYSNDVVRDSLNLWWPLQYVYNVSGGAPECWHCPVPAATISDRIGFPLPWTGLALLAAFTVANAIHLRRRLPGDRHAIFVAAALQVYAYFIFRVGVQTNHYFIAIPLMALALTPDRRHIVAYAWVSAVFIAQDLLFYGLGRDWNRGVELLTRLSATPLTVVAALVNVATFGTLSAWQFRRPS